MTRNLSVLFFIFTFAETLRLNAFINTLTMKKKNLTLWMSALLMVMMLCMLASCSKSDDAEEEPVETVVVPTDGIMARAMLRAHEWSVTLDALERWNSVQALGDYATLRNDLDEALFCMKSDHCFLAVHVKENAATHVEDRGKWLCVRLYESDVTHNYNLQPDKDNPSEGFIYDDDDRLTLYYRLLTDRSMELMVGKDGTFEVMQLIPRAEKADLPF